VIDLGLTPGPEVCVAGFPFYSENIARAINNHGQIVGHAQCIASGGALAAFLWEIGIMYNLNDRIPVGSGWDLLSATDINDDGRIVGFGINPGGELHAFLLVPDDPTAIAHHMITTRYVLAQNYPNPFNPTTKINYQIPELSFVTLKVFDILGNEIETLVNEDKPSGTHTIDFNSTNLQSGIYFYKLQTPDFTQTKKMILLK
jgi:probable HAF family extracellular repeat protein